MIELDTVGIGTSPATIFKMAALEEAGQRTLMIDKSSRVGGNWGTINLPIVGEVESGAHYIGPDPIFYKLLESILGIELFEVERAEYFLPRKIFFSHNSSYLSRWGSGVSPPLNKIPKNIAEFRSTFGPYLRCIQNQLKSFGKPSIKMKYFCGGTPGFVVALEEFIKNRDLKTKLETVVNNIEINTRDGFVQINTDRGKIIAKEFLLSSCAVLENIIVDGKSCRLGCQKMPLLQLHLVFKGPQLKEFHFGQFVQSSNLLLGTNLTPFMGDNVKNEGYSLVATLAVNGVCRDDETINRIIDELKLHNMIEGDNRLVAHHWSYYNIPQRGDAELLEIEQKYFPYIKVLPTHSFGGKSLMDLLSKLNN